MRKLNKKQRKALRTIGKLPCALKKIEHRQRIQIVLERHGEHLPESRPERWWRWFV